MWNHRSNNVQQWRENLKRAHLIERKAAKLMFSTSSGLWKHFYYQSGFKDRISYWRKQRWGASLGQFAYIRSEVCFSLWKCLYPKVNIFPDPLFSQQVYIDMHLSLYRWFHFEWGQLGACVCDACLNSTRINSLMLAVWTLFVWSCLCGNNGQALKKKEETGQGWSGGLCKHTCRASNESHLSVDVTAVDE